MEKPILNDFDLTESSHIEIEKQRERYKLACNNAYNERSNNYKIFIIFYAFILIGFVIAFIVTGATEVGDSIPMCCTGAMSVLLGIILVVIRVNKESIIDMFSPKNPLEESFVNQTILKNQQAYANACYEYERYVERQKRDFWINLNGYQFENEVAKLYRQMGYRAQVTRKTADGGVDIILIKGTEYIAVQCKHHKNKVGPNDVRALQGVVHNGNYTSGIFVSLNGFTPTVVNEVYTGKEIIELISLDDLIFMQENL